MNFKLDALTAFFMLLGILALVIGYYLAIVKGTGGLNSLARLVERPEGYVCETRINEHNL